MKFSIFDSSNAGATHPTRLFVLVLLLVSIAAMIALLVSTPYGLGLTNDSASYVNGAVNLLSGSGYTRTSGGGELKPLTHFPPLFSMILAAFGALFGGTVPDILAIGRWVIAFLFGLDVFLSGQIIYRITQSRIFALLGATIVGTSDILLSIYAFFLSEPLFITIILIGFLSIIQFFTRRTRSWLFLSGFAFGLSYLTRYVGLSLVVTTLLALALVDTDRQFFVRLRSQTLRKSLGGLRESLHPPIRSSIVEILLFLCGAIPPVVLWSLYSYASSGAVANRVLVWHPIDPAVLFEALKNLLSWIAPDDLLRIQPVWGRLLSGISLLVVPALIAYSIWIYIQKMKRSATGRVLRPAMAAKFELSLHVWMYLLFLVVSISLFDASTPLDARILSVVFIPLIILFSCGLAWLWTFMRRTDPAILKAARGALALLCVVMILYSVKDGVRVIQQLNRQGQGYAYQGITESEVIQAIQKMPPTLIYTNKPSVIYLLTGKPAYMTPSTVDPATVQTRPEFAEDFEAMRQSLLAGKSILVLFNLSRSSDPNELALDQKMAAGLSLAVDSGFAQIYAAQNNFAVGTPDETPWLKKLVSNQFELATSPLKLWGSRIDLQ